MSTMKRPEMDVVRFKEADIIVASGNIATLSGFNDNEARNGIVSYGGTDYKRDDRDSFPYDGKETLFYSGNAQTTLNALFMLDSLENSPSGFDGKYTYNENSNRFERQ